MKCKIFITQKEASRLAYGLEKLIKEEYDDEIETPMERRDRRLLTNLRCYADMKFNEVEEIRSNDLF
jgi:hypothetical protein